MIKEQLDKVFSEQLVLKTSLYINILEDINKQIKKSKGILEQINDEFIDNNTKEKIKFLEQISIFVQKEKKLENSKLNLIKKVLGGINNE